MTKNNQGPKPAKPMASWKKKLIMALLFLQAVFANAREGVVLRTISSPTESRVMLDTTNDGQADMYISIPRNAGGLYDLIRSCFDRGLRVEIDDDYILNDGNMDFSYLGGILSVGTTNPLVAFPVAANIFEAAAARRRAAQQNGGR